MFQPDFYMHSFDVFAARESIPVYLHPWVRFKEVLHMVSPGPEFGGRPILMVHEDTVAYWMMENLAKAYWPEDVNPDWVRMR